MAQSLPFATASGSMAALKTEAIAIGKTLGSLLLLLLALPINGGIVLLSFLWSQLARSPRSTAAHPKTILISGGKMTKALQLARSFHQAGHRVVLVETEKYWLSGHQFSKAVDRFYTIPAPQAHSDAYTNALLEIVRQEAIDVYVPVCSPVASYYDSLAKVTLSPHCEVFHFDPAVTQQLDDKFAFAEVARSIGLNVPKSYKITHPDQILTFDFSQETRPYILKSIPYDSVRRLDLTKLPCATAEETHAFVQRLPISPEKPWIMQEFIAGTEFCTHSTVRNGELRLHCCCRSSAFQINYEQVEHPQILAWVQRFVAALNLTGQVSFDFIEAADGTVYAIECNPRTHSAITMFYDHPGVAAAYLDSTPQAEPWQPLPQSKPTYWLYHQLWRLTGIRSLAQMQQWLTTMGRGKDAIYALHDPLPFLAVHHWQVPLLLLQNLWQRRGWVRIDFNIGKLVELGGD